MHLQEGLCLEYVKVPPAFALWSTRDKGRGELMHML